MHVFTCVCLPTCIYFCVNSLCDLNKLKLKNEYIVIFLLPLSIYINSAFKFVKIIKKESNLNLS